MGDPRANEAHACSQHMPPDDLRAVISRDTPPDASSTATAAPCKAPHEPLFRRAIVQNEAREIARHTVDELDPPRLPIRTQDCATS